MQSKRLYKSVNHLMSDEVEVNNTSNLRNLLDPAEVEKLLQGVPKRENQFEGFENSQFNRDFQRAIEKLMSGSRTAIFDDRVEYHQQDGTKLIDRGGKLAIQSGRWSTPETEAALMVDAAVAKGWVSGVLPTDSDPEFAKYVQAFAKARGLEVEYAHEVVEEKATPAQPEQSGFVPLAVAPTAQQSQQKQSEIEP